MIRLIVPSVKGVDAKTLWGFIGQLAHPSVAVEGTLTKFSVPSRTGWKLSVADGRVLYVFSKAPLEGQMPNDGAVLLGDIADGAVEADLSKCKWLAHQGLGTGPTAAQVRESWFAAFNFIGEDQLREGQVGLRRPQLGALHAIHAHWSTKSDVATVVMPTGTGKTETMLATMISGMCTRVMVIVPTDALRTQIALKFFSLGILKDPRSVLLAANVLRPVVGTLEKRLTAVEDVDELFRRCNVIVTTSALAGKCSHEVQVRMAELCTHLFIDEAHHAAAPTWHAFKSVFKAQTRHVLQFTATPFREDGVPLDGEIVYVYPMRQAQREGYFRPIRFSSVYSFNDARADRDIAAKVIEELNADATGLHVAMARVSTQTRAAQVLAIYQALGQFNPVMLHSGMKKADAQAARSQLDQRQSRIVVCVDMLGEGFDMPELKIAAFHDLRKSLAVTLQLAGRFTRSRDDLGDPVFIANVADVNLREELRTLYTQDPDWNLLLPNLSESAIGQELEAQRFMSGFDNQLDEIPVNEIRPAASMVAYRTHCAQWNPAEYSKAFPGLAEGEEIYPVLNEREGTLIIIAAKRQGVAWTAVPAVEGLVWELCIAVWDKGQSLLFVHGSTNTGNYAPFARALCGADVELIQSPAVFRALAGINRLMLMNVGLDEQFGRQVRYTGRMGPDVGARLTDTTLGTTTKAVLAGFGFENGGPASIGAGKKGRVWATLRLKVNEFAAWCKHVGAKLIDEGIDPEEILRGTLIPRLVDARPATVPVGVDWPVELLDLVESATKISFVHTVQEHLTNVSIEVRDFSSTGPIVLRVFSESREVQVRLNFIDRGNAADFEFVYEGAATAAIHRGDDYDLCAYLTDHPPTIWFADGSKLEGNTHVELRTAAQLYSRDHLEVLDWTGIDITKESQREERRTDSVQYRAIQHIKAENRHEIVFDDDGAGEAADIVGISLDSETQPRIITVDLYHCKYSGGATPGARIDDMYVVCGQAQRSVMWLHNRERRTDLFAHLLKRDADRVEGGRPTRFEVGSKDRLAQIRDLSRICAVTLRVYIVQPGLSKTGAADHQLALLGVTDRFLSETYQTPLKVYCG
ncbi:DEAD/DEAH box helicase [Variovorax fucosicus]|uniref:DEAD/DEAH box helicase n=1 Tax=Variovorax fucosicus TaxID=3053517 RepID=UPI0033653485